MHRGAQPVLHRSSNGGARPVISGERQRDAARVARSPDNEHFARPRGFPPPPLLSMAAPRRPRSPATDDAPEPAQPSSDPSSSAVAPAR
jgi:hypothetical protein